MSDNIKNENEFNELDKIIRYWFDRTAHGNLSFLILNQITNLNLLIKQYTECIINGNAIPKLETLQDIVQAIEVPLFKFVVGFVPLNYTYILQGCHQVKLVKVEYLKYKF